MDGDNGICKVPPPFVSSIPTAVAPYLLHVARLPFCQLTYVLEGRQPCPPALRPSAPVLLPSCPPGTGGHPPRFACR
eukprot:2019815-Prymnesium_polylepis.1